MKKISPAIFCLAILFSFSNIYSLTYYISTKGSNSNDGLSPNTAWNTIGKVNTEMQRFRPGDQILFERGGTYEGQINLNTSGEEGRPVTFGAYGEGADPMISGSVPVKGWKPYNRNIMQAETDFAVKNVFRNGSRMTSARFPNNGFLTITEPFKKANTGFASDQLKQKNGYWNNSTVRFRSVNWAYEYATIKNFIQGKIYFDKPVEYESQSGFGFFIDNNFESLDAANEWYFKSLGDSKGILYFMPPKGINPDDSFMEGSVYYFAFTSGNPVSHIVIRDIKMKNQIQSGIRLIDASNIRIENCTFYRMGETGVTVLIGRNCSVTNSKFYSIEGKAVYLLKSIQSEISNNVFRNTGMIAGYGSNNDAFNMCAIAVLDGSGNKISGNNILDTGHDGIDCLGEKNIIEKNVIRNSLILLNDGAAIKTYGASSRNSEISNNFVFSVFGNLEGTLRKENRIISNGIYLDALTNNMTVVGNTIINAGSGIFLYDGCKDNRFEKNKCFNNRIGITFYQEKTPMTNNLVSANYFASVTDEQAWVQLIASHSGFVPAKFTGNYYISEYGDGLYQFRSGSSVKAFNLSQWRKLIGDNEDPSPNMILEQNAAKAKLFTNMSDEKKEIILSEKFRDVSGNIISGNISLGPWSSEILFGTTSGENAALVNVAGGPIKFSAGNNAPQWFNVFGENLSKPLKIKSPKGILISLTADSDFSNSLELSVFNGKTDQIIFVKVEEEFKGKKEISVGLTEKVSVIMN